MSNRRVSSSTVSLGVLASLILAGSVAGPVAAQTAAPPAPAQTTTAPATTTNSATDQNSTTDKGTTTVTVTGAKTQNRIDRQVYDNTKNIDSATGTAADALNKVPSVNVDANGNVTLRGNSNVQVYVDGKPSAMMSGDNRAGALQAMSSSDISSVEVMNSPGAQYSSEGTGGIINLVMNKNRRPGTTGSAAFSVGSTGGYNGNVSVARNTGKLTLSGSANYRSDKRKGRTGILLEPLDGNGNPTSITQSHAEGEGDVKGFSTNGQVDYNLGDKDQLSAQANYSSRSIDIKGDTTYATYSPTMAATTRYTGHTTAKGPHEDYGVDFNWNHTGDKPGETLKADLRLSRSDGLNDSTNTANYSLGNGPGGATSTSDVKHSNNDLYNGVLSVDYARFVGQDQLSAGLQITSDNNEFINTSSGISSVSNALLTSDFAYQQTISAAYLTYQKPFGDKWVVLGGVRAEALDLKTDQKNTGVTSHINYTKLSPSFFATYVISDTKKLRFSYSHRLQRPSPQLLNPSISYIDQQNLSQGNPNLKPQETDSFELGYEVNPPAGSRTALTYSLRGYYRKNDNVITQVSTFFTPGVLLTTQQNYGSGSNAGLEFNVSGNLTKQLIVGLNGNLYSNELTTPNIAGTQKATSVSGRFNVSYIITPLDSLQFFFFTSGKQLTGQGYRSPFAMGNLSYAHKITPKATLIMTVNDPFRTSKNISYTRTNNVFSEQLRSQQGMVFYVGLRYILGGPSAAQLQQMQQQRGMWGGPGGGGPRPAGASSPGGGGGGF